VSSTTTKSKLKDSEGVKGSVDGTLLGAGAIMLGVEKYVVLATGWSLLAISIDVCV
jgi:hypothetical protein